MFFRPFEFPQKAGGFVKWGSSEGGWIHQEKKLAENSSIRVQEGGGSASNNCLKSISMRLMKEE
jgi:hypothetical protein